MILNELFIFFQTKKRYCGYMYETSDQKNPEYFAKGIETVRRDGCFAVSKVYYIKRINHNICLF